MDKAGVVAKRHSENTNHEEGERHEDLLYVRDHRALEKFLEMSRWGDLRQPL